MKIGALPMLGLAAGIGISAYATVTLDYQTRLMRAVVVDDLPVAMRLFDQAGSLQGIIAGAQGILSLPPAHTLSDNVERDIARLSFQLETTMSALAAARADIGSPVASAKITRIIEELTPIRDAIAAAGLHPEADAPAVAIQNIEKTAHNALEELSALARASVIDASRRAELSRIAVEKARISFIAVTATVAFVLGLFAFLMVRGTVRSIRSIAQATLQVARGDQVLDIARLHRRDELGAIVRSLRVFQHNVARIAFLAHHDALTGLPNRRLFHDRLELAVAQAARGVDVAVLCLDLDRFKAVNDTLGHPVGDKLLQEVARRLAACLREGDTLARLSGDEFAVLQIGVARPEDAALLAHRIVRVIGEPYEVESHRVVIGTSIGIAVTPRDGTSVDTLLKNADTALYRAKAEGRGIYRFFEQEMNAELQARRMLELDIRRAIEESQFEIHYQPLINLASRRISGFEALLRWPHPERGMVAPAEFIPVAEDTGLIITLGAWVIREACIEAAGWPEHVKIAINLSPAQFRNEDLVGIVGQALVASGLEPSRLELEITESVLLQPDDPNLMTLHRLRQMGVRISMDDFGTGYSSLSYLRSFPFDKIKIDRSFVQGLSLDGGSVAIIRAVTGLSRSLGITTTAEGVETDEQLHCLVREGCHEVQGYPVQPRGSRGPSAGTSGSGGSGSRVTAAIRDHRSGSPALLAPQPFGPQPTQQRRARKKRERQRDRPRALRWAESTPPRRWPRRPRQAA